PPGAQPGDPVGLAAAERGEAEQVAPEGERARQIGDVEVDGAVGDRLARIERRVHAQPSSRTAAMSSVSFTLSETTTLPLPRAALNFMPQSLRESVPVTSNP